MRERTHQQISAVLGSILGVVWTIVGTGFLIEIAVSPEREFVSVRGILATLLIVVGLAFLFARRPNLETER
jgi:hypothetical protein